MDALTVLQACAWLQDVPATTLASWVGMTQWLRLERNQTLIKEEMPVKAAYILVSGQLILESTQANSLVLSQSGTLIDPLVVFMGTLYGGSCRCAQAAQVLCVPIELWRSLAQTHPSVWADLTDRARDQMLSDSLRRALYHALPDCDADALVQLAFQEGRWWHMARGEPLFNSGDVFDAWYVLVSGQLAEFNGPHEGDAAFTHPDAILQPGDLAGDKAALMGAAYASSVFAMRDAWLMRLEPHEFDRFVLERPAAIRKIARHALQHSQKAHHTAHIKGAVTLTVFPSETLDDSTSLILALYQAIAHFQPLVLLNAALCESWGIVPDLNQRQRADLEWLRLDAWLQHQHDRGRQVLLVADPRNTVWSAQVARLADRVLLLADAQGAIVRPPQTLWPLAPSPDNPPRASANAWDLQYWLCLVHPADTAQPKGTLAWLRALEPQRHFHLRRSNAKDLGRLVRHLTHQAIGLALSGGGGRGPAHAGVFRALEQANIPIDCVVGASAGASMGCLFAQDQGWQYCAQQAIAGIGPPPGPFSDLTLPMVSIVKSERLYESVCRTFGNEQLEDAWIPCFVVVTNLTRMRKTVFSQGDVWQAALASASPPAVAKPRIVQGELLCDGGLIENLPVSVLLEQGCRYIIASNIATELNLTLNAPDFPSPWVMLFDRLFRQGQATADIPSAIDILLASTTLASEDNRQAMADFIDVTLTPNLKGFKPTDFKRSSELIAQGFTDACAQIAHHRSAKGSDSEFWRITHKSAALPWPCADTDFDPTL